MPLAHFLLEGGFLTNIHVVQEGEKRMKTAWWKTAFIWLELANSYIYKFSKLNQCHYEVYIIDNIIS